MDMLILLRRLNVDVFTWLNVYLLRKIHSIFHRLSIKKKGVSIVEIGTKIAQARREQGITQVELADKMSVTRQTVSRWETGAAFPDIEKVAGLAEILQVSCDYLLKENLSVKDGEPSMEGTEILEKRNSVTKLLSGIVGKNVRITFYEDEEDLDMLNKICNIDCFEGNWAKVTVQHKNKEQKKLIALSSVLSFEIVE